MVLTDRQRKDLHAGIYEYLKSRPGEAFAQAAAALQEADPEACSSTNGESKKFTTPLLEKKWTAIPRLQKKVLELERQAAQSAKIHAHRAGLSTSSSMDNGVQRRMLPRLPCQYTLKGHSMGVTAVSVHPIFTVVASGSEDGTIKVSYSSTATNALIQSFIQSINHLPTHTAILSIPRHYFHPRSGTTKVANTCAHSKDTPTLSMRSTFLPRVHTSSLVPRTCPSNYGISNKPINA